MAAFQNPAFVKSLKTATEKWLYSKYEIQVASPNRKLEIKRSHQVKVTSVIENYLGTESESGEVYQARAVLLATGSTPRRLSVSGEKDWTGKAVAYCAICDGPLFIEAILGDEKVTGVLLSNGSVLETDGLL